MIRSDVNTYLPKSDFSWLYGAGNCIDSGILRKEPLRYNTIFEIGKQMPFLVLVTSIPSRLILA